MDQIICQNHNRCMTSSGTAVKPNQFRLNHERIDFPADETNLASIAGPGRGEIDVNFTDISNGNSKVGLGAGRGEIGVNFTDVSNGSSRLEPGRDESEIGVNFTEGSNGNSKVDPARGRTEIDVNISGVSNGSSKVEKLSPLLSDGNINRDSNTHNRLNITGTKTTGSSVGNDTVYQSEQGKLKPTYTSTGYLQDGLARFRQQISDWLVIAPQPKPRYLVYVCEGACGGWADRQEGTVSTFLLALLTGRQFYIQYEKPCALTAYYVPHRIDWRMTSTLKNKLESVSPRKLVVRDVEAFKLGEILATQDPNTVLKDDVIFFNTNQDFCRYLKFNPIWKNLLWAKGMNCSSIYTAVWEHLFRLSPLMEAKFLEFTEGLRNPPGNKSGRYTLVCAQFRLKRNPTIPNDNLAHDELNHEPIWQYLHTYNNSDKYRIFVASDAEHMTKLAKTKFPGLLLDIPGQIVHVDLVGSRADLCTGLQKVLLDQLALSSCDITMRGYHTHLGAIAAYWRGRNDNLHCFNGTVLSPCSLDDPDFHWGPLYQPGMTNHWQPFVDDL